MMRASYAAETRKALALWDGKPAAWGVDDCALALCDIDVAVCGEDTGAEYRGRYDDESGARRVLGRGGLLAAWGKVARARKWKRIKAASEALDGDRAVALHPQMGVTSVIRLGGFWVGRLDRGNFLVGDDAIIRAWSIG